MIPKPSFFLFFFSIFIFSQSKTQINDLKDFAKVYGVIRYFHPSDEASKINWNQFAVYGTEKVLKAEGKEKNLKNLFLPIAPSVSFDGKNFTWNQDGLFPVFWIHNGLGIDNNKLRKDYFSKRYNREKSLKKEYNYFYLNIIPKSISSTIKIVYEAKSNEGGESFAYANIFNSGVEKPNFKTHQYNPIISEEWEKKELVIDNSLPVSRVNIGFMTTEQGSEFRNIQLFYQNEGKEWVLYKLPPFQNEDWKVNKPSTQIERNIKGVRFTENKEAISSNGINPYSITWNKYEKIELSDGLNVIIPTVVYSDKKSTLPISEKNSIKEIQSYLKFQPFNRNVAIANVFISWNILTPFYPYQDVIKVNWDEILEKALIDAYDDKNEYDNYLTLSRFGSHFDDGHLSFYYKGLNDKRTYAPNVAVRYINDKLIVKNVVSGIGGINKGDIITDIDNISTKKYIDSLQQYISGSKQYKNWVSSQALLKGSQNSLITFTLSNGKKTSLIRDVNYVSNIDFYTRDDVTKSKEINSDTYYVNMDKLSAEEMENEISNIRKYKNLIIDLRGYPRTDQGHQLLNYLLPIKDSTKWLCAREIFLPDFNHYNETCNGHRLRKFISDNPLKTNNVLLVDERSVSNAEMFAQTVKYYKLATIIGRTTAGANGNRNDINLLNGFLFSFTGLKVVNPDGSRFHAIGVTPDVFVNESSDDFRNGKDVYIEKALEFFKNKKNSEMIPEL